MPSIYQWPLTVAPQPVSLYVKPNKRKGESEAGVKMKSIHFFLERCVLS